MADVTVDRLQVEIESNAKTATTGLDALSATLGKIKNATRGGAGLGTFSKHLTTFNNALAKIDAANAAKLGSITDSLSKLGGLGKIKISSTIATQLNSISGAIHAFDGVNLGSISTLADSLPKLNGITLSKTLGSSILNISNAINQIGNVKPIDPTVIKNLNDLGMGLQSFAGLADIQFSGIGKLASSMSNLGNIKPIPDVVFTNMDKLAAAVKRLDTALDDIDNSRLNALSNAMTAATHSTNNLSKATKSASLSYVNFAAKIGIAYAATRRFVSIIGDWIRSSNRYQENLNLFNASLGQYADEALEYAKKVEALLGIDHSEFIRNQGIFNTLLTGFGVGGEQAAFMSKNLTQLGYDLSSFFNMSFNDSMLDLQSAIAGELEPVRRLGYALSQTSLQEQYGKELTLQYSNALKQLETDFTDSGLSAIALSLGMKKNIQDMTEAEKSVIRYTALLRQNIIVQGDLARTLDSPSNQLRILTEQWNILSREIGNVFIPILNKVLPYVIAFVKVLRELAGWLATLAGFELTTVDYGDTAPAVAGIGEIGSGLTDATEKAKELKNNLLGIDELNVISKDDSAGSGSGGASGGGLGFEIPDYGDFLPIEIMTKVDEIMAKIKPFLDWVKKHLDLILAVATAIGAAILAWKVLKFLADLDDVLAKLKAINKIVGALEVVIGGVLIWDGWKKLHDNDPLNDLMGVLETMLGGLLVADGLRRLIGGEAGVMASRIFTLALAAYLAWEGFRMLTDNSPENDLAGVLATSFAFLTAGFTVGNLIFKNTLAGVLGASIGLAIVITGLQILFPEQWDNAMTQISDWINKFFNVSTTPEDITNTVNIATAVLFGVTALVGILNKIGLFKSADVVSAPEAAGKVGEGVGQVSSKLKSLAKNLALGLVIIVEVAAAALLFTGAVWILGKELEQVGIAWQPVIDNGETILTAMGIGTGILAAIGVVTGVLGTVGGPTLIANMALGTAILVEIGIATGLFIIEIIAVGKGLEEVGKAWQPVIDNGGTIAIAMGIGVGVLAAVGAVTALLGSAGTTLIVNMGLGIAVLAEIGIAAGLFIVEIWAIGKGLAEIEKAWKPVLSNGESIATAIGLGTALLVGIGVVTAALGVATVATAGALPLAIGLGTAILLELGIATGLFVIEIVGIGKGLEEIDKAWEPVLSNGKAIATAIGVGTGLLIGIGVVTAALGVATVASAGLLPLAIGLGTALLVELAAATILFTKSLVAVADELSDNLYPALTNLNGKLPTLTTNMQNFVKFMGEFAGYVVTFSKDNAVAGIAATIDTIIGWFTVDPFQKLSDDVFKITGQITSLNTRLNAAITELNSALTLLKEYKTLLTQVKTEAGYESPTVGGIIPNIVNIGVAIVEGIKQGLQNAWQAIKEFVGKFIEDFKSALGIHSPSTVFAEIGKNLIDGLFNGLKTIGDSIQTWFNTNVITPVRNAFDAFLKAVSGFFSTAWTDIKSIWNTVKAWFDTNIVTPVRNAFDAFLKAVSGFFSTAWTDIKKTWEGVLTWFDTKVINPVRDAFDTALTKIKNFFDTAWTDIKKTWEGVLTWFDTKIINPVRDAFDDAVDAIFGFFDGLWKDIKGIFDDIGDWITGLLQDLGLVKDKADDAGSAASSKSSKSSSTAAYASGGFPAIGQLFFAREAGPELVGTMGGRTAVANNAQIVAGISSGVFSAVRAAMSGLRMSMAVDTSSMRSYEPRSYAVPASGSSYAVEDYSDGFEEALRNVFDDYRMTQLVDDMRRQADKPEQTVLNVDGRKIAETVDNQKKANGYSFVTA